MSEPSMSVVRPHPTFDLVDNLSRDLELSVKEVGALLDIHPRTLQRRQERGKLEEVELLKAQMLNEVFTLATTAFHGSETAKGWLFSEVAALEFARPVDLLRTIQGYERVKTVLGQIIFGVY